MKIFYILPFGLCSLPLFFGILARTGRTNWTFSQFFVFGPNFFTINGGSFSN